MIQSTQPHPNLQVFIKEYYLIEKKLDEVKMKIPIVDDCCHDIILFKEQEASLRYGPNEELAQINHKIFTILGLEPPYALETKNNLTFFTIKFQPWMNRNFFGNLGTKGITDLNSYHATLLNVFEKLKQGFAMKQLVESADTIFLNEKIVLTPKMIFIKEVCEFITKQSGLVKVRDLAVKYNKSRQYINKTFREEVMCNLKTFITSVRILSLVKQKAKTNDLSLTQITYDFGYFDQAHFINDFKKVCGVTPSYYFENLPEFILRHQ